MDRAILLEHLQQVTRHASEWEARVTRQRGIVQRLNELGHDAAAAVDLLETFMQSLAEYAAQVKRLEAELRAM